MLPLPTNTGTEIATDRAPVKHDLYNLDSLISDLNTPKEIMQGAPAPGESPGQNRFNRSPANEIIDFPEIEPIPAEVAALSGKTIAGTIDTGLGFGFSLFAKNRTPEKYQANDNQREQLNQAWAAVAQRYNYKMEDSPWFNLILLNVFIYFPAFQEAQTDRRFALQDEKMKEMDLRLKENEARVKAMEVKPAT